MHRYQRKFIWIGLGLGAALLRMSLAGNPGFIERYYSRGLFPALRWLVDYLLAWFPLPLIYLFLPGLLFLAGRNIRRWWKRPYAYHWQRALDAFLGVAATAGALAFFFLFLWGFNYGRVSVEEQLGLELEPLSLTELKEELRYETEAIKRLRPKIAAAGGEPILAEQLPGGLEQILRQEVEAWLEVHGFPSTGRVRGLRMWPKGIFLRFGSSGLYFPWTGEGHVDAGLHPLQLPFVMAHELSHGYGIGDEGSCNFIAYLACTQSDNLVVAYAGHLSYWRTLAANYRRYEPEAYHQFRESLPLGIQADLDAINDVLRRYPDIMPYFRDYAYNAYLKAQGIEEGMENYNRVLMMVRAWRVSQRI